MNPVTERGVLSHDIKDKDDDNKIDGSIECSDVSHGINVTATQTKEVISANDKVVVEESVNTYQKRKRLKILEITNEDDEVQSNENCDDANMPALTQLEMQNDEVAINRRSGDMSMFANNPMEEVDDKASKTVGIVEAHNADELEEKSNLPTDAYVDALSQDSLQVQAHNVELEEKSNSTRDDYVDALSKDSVQQPQPEQQPEQQSDDNISFEKEQLDDDSEIENEGIDVAVDDNIEIVNEGIGVGVDDNTEVVNEGIDVAVDNNVEDVNEGIDVAVDMPIAVNAVRKLLVLDLNGLLVHISSFVPCDYDGYDIIMKKAVFRRPYCDDFLQFCFDMFNVGVWTSRTKTNMEPIIDYLFGNDRDRLFFCWDQSHCTDTGFTDVEFRYKPLLLKKLKKLWDKGIPDLPWEKGVYNETNTLLLDDSPPKSICNPLYNAVFPYSYEFYMTSDDSLGPDGDLRNYLEGLAVAENVQDYVRQNPFGQRPVTETNLSWGYYRKVIEACTTPPRETEQDDAWR